MLFLIGEHPTPATWGGFNFNDAVLRYEARIIVRALKEAGGVVSRAAGLLGLKRQALDSMLKGSGRHKALAQMRAPVRHRKSSLMFRDEVDCPETRTVVVLHVERQDAPDPVRAKLALAAIRRLHAITAEIKTMEVDIAAALELRPHRYLIAIPGVGPLVAAKILGEAHDVRHFHSAAAFAAHAGTAPVPASSGNTHRHRLARGGNRQLNRALFTIAMVQARWHPEARDYLARKRSEGKTPAEARRCLKRHLATAIYRAMLKDLAPSTETAVPTST